MVRDRWSARGITLIEALVVLAVLSIAMAVAIPNMRAYSVRSKLLSPVRDAERLLSLARLQALNSQRPVIIAFMKANTVWDEWPSEPFTRQDSVVAFLDNDGSGLFSTGDKIVESYVFPKSMTYKRPSGAEPLPLSRIAFDAGGALSPGANAEFYVGDNIGNYIRIVMVGAVGSARRQMYDSATGMWIGQADEPRWPWRY